jgi:hypothetical protein
MSTSGDDATKETGTTRGGVQNLEHQAKATKY